MQSACLGMFMLTVSTIDFVLIGCSERKRSHDKHYPKGYVEMLEQQQSQLVSGLKEMYHRLQKASAWDGPALDESTGQPLTHDILKALDLLESKHDESGETEAFEESCDKLQSKLLAEGAGFAHRRSSISSESDHSHHDRPKTSSRRDTPVQPKPSLFKESFNFPSATSSPLMQSPIPRSKPFPEQYPPTNMSSRQAPPPPPTSYNDPHLYQNEWTQALADMASTPEQRYAIENAEFNHLMNGHFGPSPQSQLDSFDTFSPYPNQMINGNFYGANGQYPMGGDFGPLDSSMDIDFSKFVQQTEVMT